MSYQRAFQFSVVSELTLYTLPSQVRLVKKKSYLLLCWDCFSRGSFILENSTHIMFVSECSLSEYYNTECVKESADKD